MNADDNPESAPRLLVAGDADVRLRLDRFLARRLGISRVEARRLLAEGRVARDGHPLALRHKGLALTASDAISVSGFVPPRERRPLATPEAALTVLAAGEGWVAVDKPSGCPVHPLRADQVGTVLNAALARWPEMMGVGEGGLRSGVVHRLDVDTSGVLLLATREEAWRRLRDLFAAHRVEKVYRAIVLGRVDREGTIELPLRVARSRPARVVVSARANARDARACTLSWRPLAPLRGATLVEARPVTGFLHQVRVTFAHLGWPLAGDRLYGPATDDTGATRHMLHAARLALAGIDAACPDAADFAALLAKFRL